MLTVTKSIMEVQSLEHWYKVVAKVSPAVRSYGRAGIVCVYALHE